MRIIAGSLGGRQFDAPKGRRTHPMSEKARGGLFSALGDIEGLTVLDAFTGSGAVSFEAISRGAEHATSVDIDMGAITTVVKSSKELGIPAKIKAIRANASGWSDNNSREKFDIVVCDPPFDQFKTSIIQKLVKHVSSGGIFIVNMPSSLDGLELPKLKQIKVKKYGDTTLVFYKFT